MDSLYYNAPKPFNKYPTGYRPMNGSGSMAAAPASSLRHFGSMSSLSHLPSHPINHPAPSLNQNYSNSIVSLADINQNYQPPARITQRTGSVGPYGEMSYIDSTFSSRAASPMRTFSPIRDPPRPAMSPPYRQQSNNTTMPRQERFAADDFLDKLRRQKEEIERTFSRPFYEEPEPPQQPLQSRYGVDPYDHRSLPVGGQRVEQLSHWNSPPAVPQLHKTRSDSHIVHDRLNPNVSLPDSVIPPPMTRSYNERNQDSGYNQGGSLLDNAVNHAPRDGFFRRSLIEPNWMTNPPPPIDIQPRNSRNGYNSNRNSMQGDRNSMYRDADDSRVIPIQLDDDRILKIFAPQPAYEPEHESRHYPPHVPLSVQTTSPLMHPAPIRSDSPRQYRNSRAFSPPSFELEQTRYPPQPQQHFHSAPASALGTPMSIATQVQPPPAPPPPPPPPLISNPPARLQRVQSNQDFGSKPQYMERERSRTPTGFPEVPQSFREELMSAIPQRARQTPFNNHHVNVLRQDDAPFSPVASKVYPGTNRINGFIHDTPTPSAGSFQPMDHLVAQQPGRSRERSFAVVSRPQTPPASLESVRQFSPPTIPRGRDFSPPSRSTFGIDPLRRDFSPPSRPPLQEQTRTFSPVTSFSPPSSIATNRSQMSPMSNYDNDSENETKFGSRPNGFGQHQRTAPQRLFSPPPHGILIKNHEMPRPAKKVVFQCDPDVMSRIRTADQRFGASASPGSAEVPPHVKLYDDAMEDVLSRFNSLSDQIGGDVSAMRLKVTVMFDNLRTFLWTAAGKAKPSDAEIGKILEPISKLLSEIEAFKDSKRNTPLHNHLAAVGDSIGAVAFVVQPKTPAPHIKEMLDSGMFYINRILKEFKESNPTHVEWAKTWKEVLETLHTFVRQTHTTGLVWNSAPGSAPPGVTSRPSGSAPPPPPAGGPPPPPPPPPANLMAGMGSASENAGREALFAELNKGEGVTSGLKKVSADMMTHKNPSLRGQGAPVPSSGAAKTSSTAAAPVKNTPKIELQAGKQWNIEYHKDNKNIVINVDDKKQTVYVFKCENSVIVVKGKLNSITLDGCKKTSIVFDALVAQCETINCQSVQIQTLGEMPTLSIQKTDGCQVYLSEAAKNTEIVTSKSSEMNILVPQGDGDFTEFPVPEQFKTVYQGGKLVTSVSDIC